MSQRARKRGANHCDWVQAKGTDTCLASAPGGWEFVSKGGEAGGACPPGPDPERRSRQEALSARVSRAPPPVPYPRAAHRQSSPTARGSGRPRSVGGSGAPATPAAQYLRTRRRDPRIARQHTYAPYNSARAWRAVMTSSVAPVTSEGHGGGSGTLADCSSAEEKALCPAPSSAAGTGPGGRSRGGLRSRASSYPGGRVSAGTALGPSLSLAICKWAELRVTVRI